MNPIIKRSVTIMIQTLSAATLAACGSATSGTVVTQASGDGSGPTQAFEFDAKGHVRMTKNGDDSLGVILRDGRQYFFGTLNGKPVVVDLRAAAAKAAEHGMTPQAGERQEKLLDIEPTGRKEILAGIEGEVHRARWETADGERSEEVLLTRDRRLAPLAKALAADLAQNPPEQRDGGSDLMERGWFPLRWSGQTVTSVSFEPVPESRLALQAEPGDDMRVMFEVAMSAALSGSSAEPEEEPAPAKPKTEDIPSPVPADLSAWPTISNAHGVTLKAPPDYVPSMMSRSGGVRETFFSRSDMESRTPALRIGLKSYAGAFGAQEFEWMDTDAMSRRGRIGYQPYEVDGAKGYLRVVDEAAHNFSDRIARRRISLVVFKLQGDALVPTVLSFQFEPEDHDKAFALAAALIPTLKIGANEEAAAPEDRAAAELFSEIQAFIAGPQGVTLFPASATTSAATQEPEIDDGGATAVALEFARTVAPQGLELPAAADLRYGQRSAEIGLSLATPSDWTHEQPQESEGRASVVAFAPDEDSYVSLYTTPPDPSLRLEQELRRIHDATREKAKLQPLLGSRVLQMGRGLGVLTIQESDAGTPEARREICFTGVAVQNEGLRPFVITVSFLSERYETLAPMAAAMLQTALF